MKKNLEIYNYLNLINPKLGKIFQLKGQNPLPNDFVLTNESIEEVLTLKKISTTVSLPSFIYGEKKKIKKYLKNSIKNAKKLIKNGFLLNFSPIFTNKFNFYLIIRNEISKLILKNFKKYDFNEIEAFNEIYSLNPVFAEQLEGLFEESANFEILLKDLEERYSLSYLEKCKLLEMKKKKRKKENLQTVAPEIISEKILSAEKENETKAVATGERTQKINSPAEKSKKLPQIEKEKV